MIYFDFKNYEEFKEIFGVIEHGNGVKSRKNKILLALYKDKKTFKQLVRFRERMSLVDMLSHTRDRFYKVSNTHHYALTRSMLKKKLNSFSELDKVGLLMAKSLPELKGTLFSILGNPDFRTDGSLHALNLNHRNFFSDSFETDDMVGLCEDGTLNAIRYRNIEKNRVFKMKAGKMFNHILSCNVVTRELPEQIGRWLSEEFVAEWIEYARQNIKDDEFTLNVDDNFSAIYDTECCAGYDEDGDSFGSCMMDDDQWTFYRDAVDASAAYLTDDEGTIYARCIIFNNVIDQDGKVWRLAERQYSRFSDLSLQRQLISALIRGGHIDGYKCVGASCHDPRKFVDNEGNSLGDYKFRIDCHLEDGDTISYQDSFKYYDHEQGIATNYGVGEIDLSVTDSYVNIDGPEMVYSEYHETDIPEEEATFVESRNDYFYNYEVVEARVYSNGRYYWENCFENDCIEIDDDYYYAGENAEEPYSYGIDECSQCGCYYLINDSYRSDVMDESYCCAYCRDSAEESWYEEHGYCRSDYDGKWYPEDEVIEAFEWCFCYRRGEGYGFRYKSITIGIDTLEELIENNMATYVDDVPYVDKIGYDGEPAHLVCAEIMAA